MPRSNGNQLGVLDGQSGPCVDASLPYAGSVTKAYRQRHRDSIVVPCRPPRLRHRAHDSCGQAVACTVIDCKSFDHIPVRLLRHSQRASPGLNRLTGFGFLFIL
jgi:hypothetical protein